MRRRQPPPQAVVRRCDGRVGRPRRRRPLRDGQRVRDEPGEVGRDRLRVSGAAEDAVDAAGRDRGEEVLQVEPQDDAAAGVAAGMGERRVAAAKAVGGVVRRDRLEDRAQQPPLGLLEQRAWAARSGAAAPRPGAASGSGSCAAARSRDAPLQATAVGQPGELAGCRSSIAARSAGVSSAGTGQRIRPIAGAKTAVGTCRGGCGSRPSASSRCSARSITAASSRGRSAGRSR